MAENSGFFDAHLVDGEYDRVYLAESFAKYFASFIGNGIFGGKSNELMVQQKTAADMSVRVLPGQAWINGYWYENESELSLSIDLADGVLNRIDLIVLRWDNSERVIRLAVKKGTPATNAAAPQLQRDADYYELMLAKVYIKAGAISIIQANITDMRLDYSLCGLVQGVVQQFDTTEFGIQLDSYIKAYAENYKKWIDQLEFESTEEIEALKAELEAIIADNDLVVLSRDVEKLKKYAVEEEEGLGYFYRINEQTGMQEWINPPNAPGWEYPLVERWDRQTVYQMTFYAASLPNKGAVVIETNADWDKIVSISGYALDRDDLTSYPFPVTLHSQVTPIAVISRIEGNGTLVLTTNGDATRFEAYITVKYTKSS